MPGSAQSPGRESTAGLGWGRTSIPRNARPAGTAAGTLCSHHLQAPSAGGGEARCGPVSKPKQRRLSFENCSAEFLITCCAGCAVGAAPGVQELGSGATPVVASSTSGRRSNGGAQPHFSSAQTHGGATTLSPW